MIMAETEDVLGEARDAFARRDWAAARELFTAADEQGELDVDDVHALAETAWWVGDVDEALATYERAYRLYLDGEQPRRAAMSALDVAVSLLLRGDTVMGSGWMSRAQRLLREHQGSAEHGYALCLEVETEIDDGDIDAVLDKARRIQAIGRDADDPNLTTLGMICEGRAHLRDGRVGEGVSLLDEAMLAVVAGELDPVWAGDAYCHMIGVCHELGDLHRAAEWTEALERWCAQHSSATLFRGICRVRRAQLLHVQGAWARAESEALQVCEELERIQVASVAEARYEIGEIRRLRGDVEGAEEAYVEASRLGRDPQPGLALLRLAQGQDEAARSAVEVALATTEDRLARAPLLAADVEIALAGGDVDRARDASEELAGIAETYGTSGLEALATHARGALLVADGDAGAGAEVLRDACRRWQELRAPYDAARVRTLLAEVYTTLGDDEAAQRELDAAAAVFDELGAVVDARRIAELRGEAEIPGGLTDREAEVLRHVARGATNREIAGTLYISEKTVARHLSNIFTKLGVSSRTEAAAFAFDHGIVHVGRG